MRFVNAYRRRVPRRVVESLKLLSAKIPAMLEALPGGRRADSVVVSPTENPSRVIRDAAPTRGTDPLPNVV